MTRRGSAALRLLLTALPLLIAAAAAARPELWQTSSQGDDVYVIDLATRRLVRRLEVGPQPHGIAAPSDGSVVFVSLEANGRERGELLWIDPRDFEIEHRLAVGPEPHQIATTPDGRFVHVPCRDGSYWVVDARERRVVTRVETGGRPHNTSATSDGAWMMLSAMDAARGVSVVDVASGHRVVGTIRFAGSVRPPALSPTVADSFSAWTDSTAFRSRTSPRGA